MRTLLTTMTLLLLAPIACAQESSPAARPTHAEAIASAEDPWAYTVREIERLIREAQGLGPHEPEFAFPEEDSSTGDFHSALMQLLQVSAKIDHEQVSAALEAGFTLDENADFDDPILNQRQGVFEEGWSALLNGEPAPEDLPPEYPPLYERMLDTIDRVILRDRLDRLAEVEAFVPPRYGYDPLQHTLIFEGNATHSIARANAALMDRAIESRNPRRFLRLARRNLALSRFASTGGFFINLSIAYRIERLTIERVLRAAEAGVLTRLQIIEFQRILEEQRPIPMTVAIEIDMLAGMHLQAILEPEDLVDMPDSTLPQRLAKGAEARRVAEQLRPIEERLAMVESCYTQAFDFTHRDPATRNAAITRYDELIGIIESDDERRWGQLNRKIVTNNVGVVRLHSHAAFRDGIITQLALEVFREENGVYPESLDEFIDVWLDPGPMRDPWTNNQLIYRKLEDGEDPHNRGYLLYSTGPDGVDNGGIDATKPRFADPTPSEGEDLVINWRNPETTNEQKP